MSKNGYDLYLLLCTSSHISSHFNHVYVIFLLFSIYIYIYIYIYICYAYVYMDESYMGVLPEIKVYLLMYLQYNM